MDSHGLEIRATCQFSSDKSLNYRAPLLDSTPAAQSSRGASERLARPILAHGDIGRCGPLNARPTARRVSSFDCEVEAESTGLVARNPPPCVCLRPQWPWARTLEESRSACTDRDSVRPVKSTCLIQQTPGKEHAHRRAAYGGRRALLPASTIDPFLDAVIPRGRTSQKRPWAV